MTDPRATVEALCREFGLEIIDPRRYPVIGQTRAVKTMMRILRRYGEDHLRWVLRTLVETNNNKALLTEVSLWAASDLIRACPAILETQPSEWLEFWDDCPVGELQFWTQDLSGVVSQRHALAGMIYERLVRRFGPRYMQPDLLDDRRQKL